MFGFKKKSGIYEKELALVNKYDLSACTEDELFNMSDELRHRAINGEKLDKLMTEAFALVKEAVKRTLGLELFDTQIMAASALHTGHIVEMDTGEGKTLAAVLPAYLNSLRGEGVHILTFNDYLAKRDALWMKPVYDLLGVTVGYITEDTPRERRRELYGCDVTYICAKEAGFDYLRDFMASSADNIVQREFNFAIVDEADSVLVDEARIPLVIAGNVKRDNSFLIKINSYVKEFEAERDFKLNKYAEKVSLTEEGLSLAERLLGVENLYSEENTEMLEVLLSSLYANFILKKDKDYIVRDGDIEIVDEFTGRVAEKRQYPDILQDAVRMKEGIISSQKSMILNSIPLQHFLSMYKKISGMTGTANPAGDEFFEYYNLEIVRIEPHIKCIRKDLPDIIFKDRESKMKMLVKEIEDAHLNGQPVLIGTGSVLESEGLYEELKKKGIECEVLNAKNDEEEADIIKNAGAYGAVTVSTNMAGRGVDIRLGGFDQKDYEKVFELGGLYVIGTNRNESRRIDNQLRGRAGRQGDPGKTRFFVSLEDDMMKKYEVKNFLPEKGFSCDENGVIEDKNVTEAVAWLQRRVETYNENARIQLLKYTYVIEQQRRIIHDKCMSILNGQTEFTLLKNNCGEKYNQVCEKFGENVAKKCERDLTLYHTRKAWSEYIDYMEYEKEGIHLVIIGQKDPVDEYNRIAVNAFSNMTAEIDSNVIESFLSADVGKNGIELEKMGLEVPAATWTYLINENKAQFSAMEAFVKFVAGKFKKND